MKNLDVELLGLTVSGLTRVLCMGILVMAHALQANSSLCGLEADWAAI